MGWNLGEKIYRAMRKPSKSIILGIAIGITIPTVAFVFSYLVPTHSSQNINTSSSGDPGYPQGQSFNYRTQPVYYNNYLIPPGRFFR
jgi:hypothetical protein